jgi:hypothetical protein
MFRHCADHGKLQAWVPEKLPAALQAARSGVRAHRAKAAPPASAHDDLAAALLIAFAPEPRPRARRAAAAAAPSAPSERVVEDPALQDNDAGGDLEQWLEEVLGWAGASHLSGRSL